MLFAEKYYDLVLASSESYPSRNFISTVGNLPVNYKRVSYNQPFMLLF